MNAHLIDEDARLFFVVDSYESNEEIFETLIMAKQYFENVVKDEDGARVYVGLVRNSYKEFDKKGNMIGWNYDDQADTFTLIQDCTPEVKYLVGA